MVGTSRSSEGRGSSIEISDKSTRGTREGELAIAACIGSSSGNGRSGSREEIRRGFSSSSLSEISEAHLQESIYRNQFTWSQKMEYWQHPPLWNNQHQQWLVCQLANDEWSVESKNMDSRHRCSHPLHRWNRALEQGRRSLHDQDFYHLYRLNNAFIYIMTGHITTSVSQQLAIMT